MSELTTKEAARRICVLGLAKHQPTVYQRIRDAVRVGDLPSRRGGHSNEYHIQETALVAWWNALYPDGITRRYPVFAEKAAQLGISETEMVTNALRTSDMIPDAAVALGVSASALRLFVQRRKLTVELAGGQRIVNGRLMR